MLPLYYEKCKIMYTDTDSLIYHIECDDYMISWNAISLSSIRAIIRLTTCTVFHSSKISGLMKDENNGTIMTEFVGLRAKMYALRVDDKKDTKKVSRVTL